MPITIRPATASDAAAMCAVLNPIIATGGTTAHQKPYDAELMQAHYVAARYGISCFVAEIDGTVVGFQSLEWSDPSWTGDGFLPANWGIIASFVASSVQGRGVGRALFAATQGAARTAGVVTIDATIRADNSGGLAFYSAQGFVDYDRLADVPLRDGTRVDRIRKRFDL